MRDPGFSSQGPSSPLSSLLSSALVGSEAIGQRREPNRRHHIVGARVRRPMFFCGTGGEEGRRMVTSETEAQAVLGRRCSEEKKVGGGPGKPSTSRLNSYNTVFRSGHLWESRTRVCLCVSIFERPFFCSINIDDHRLIQVGNWTEKANCAQYLSTPTVFFF